jgi:hypothetical protein
VSFRIQSSTAETRRCQWEQRRDKSKEGEEERQSEGEDKGEGEGEEGQLRRGMMGTSTE